MLVRKLVQKYTQRKQTKYFFMFHDETTGQNHDIKVANKSFENVAKFKYLGTTVTNQN
jgi:hypothetical protein